MYKKRRGIGERGIAKKSSDLSERPATRDANEKGRKKKMATDENPAKVYAILYEVKVDFVDASVW